MNKKVKNRIDEPEDDGYAVVEFAKNDSKKKRRLKSVLLLAFNILVIAVIIIVEFAGNRETADIRTVLSTWGENWYFLVALFGLVILYFASLMIRLSLLIYSTTGRPRLKLSFSTAMLGKYYDYITPFGSGGQPFQMFNLGRKLDVGLATSIPISDYVVRQFVFTIMAIVVFIVNSDVMAGNTFLQIAAYVGIVVFAAIPIAVIVLSIYPKAIKAPLRFFCRVGHKLHLIKNLEKAENKVISGVEKYASSLKMVGKKWRFLVFSAVFATISWWIYHSLPYFVLRVCGVTPDYFDTVCMSIFVFAAIVVVPTPGGAGAAEGAFYAIFSALTGDFLFWGTMLWRFSLYYITLISGFSITIYQYVHAARKEKRAARAALAMSAQTVQGTEAGDSVDDIAVATDVTDTPPPDEN